MSTGYKIIAQNDVHYLTLQIVGWVDVFTRQIYRDIIIENFKYCQQNKGLIIYAYVIMSNHIHLLVQSQTNNLSNIIRDFKSYTSKVILETIQTERESRKDWMLTFFESAAREHERNSKFQFWTHDNHAEHIFSEKFAMQKLDYIHMNPVKAGIVNKPEEYIYSSATNYAGLFSVLEVNVLSLMWKSF